MSKNPGVCRRLASGFRNSHRMSFHQNTGQPWVGDVGQTDIEEVDIVRAGGNYGWPVKEGTFTFHAGTGLDPNGGFVSANTPHLPPALIDPVAECDHTAPSGSVEQGEAILGGFVYRGSGVPALAGDHRARSWAASQALPLEVWPPRRLSRVRRLGTSARRSGPPAAPNSPSRSVEDLMADTPRKVPVAGPLDPHETWRQGTDPSHPIRALGGVRADTPTAGPQGLEPTGPRGKETAGASLPVPGDPGSVPATAKEAEAC